jgi:lipid A 4'-phosphatase
MVFLRAPRIRGYIIIGCLLVFGFTATAWIDSRGEDLAWANAFYQKGGPHGGWIYARDHPWDWLYDYGEFPGIVMAIGALALYIASRYGRAARRYARPSLVVVLAVVIGPGLVVNGILKDCWGRPRPSDLIVFGGTLEFRKASQPEIGGGGKSFACGHCSVAYAVVSAGAFFPYYPIASATMVVAGIAFGTVVGLARMAQGGHFATDVLWSAVIVLAIIAALYYLIFRISETDPN